MARSEGTVRLGTKADRDSIGRLVNQAFVVERCIKRGGGDRLDEQEGELDELLERGRFLILEDGMQEGGMQEDKGGPLACVYLEPRGERCYLGMLSVAPKRKGQGLGRKMMAAAEEFARAEGCGWMELRVVSPRREELVPLYRKFGYSEQGTEEYPPGLQEKMVSPGHFIAMGKPLG